MKTKNIFFSSLFLIAAYSCSLENETYDQLGSDNVMTTENDVKAAVTGIYHELRGGGWDRYNCAWGSLLTMQIGCTDECDCNWIWDKQLDFLWTAETTDLGQFYTGLVPAVTKATSLLERMRKISISAPIKRRYMAEVRCLRAMWAYDLYDLYGTVPLITDPDIALDPQKAQSYMPERPSIEWYVNFIDTELKEAEENLKPASLLAASEYGRMTKGIAQMYMLKRRRQSHDVVESSRFDYRSHDKRRRILPAKRLHVDMVSFESKEQRSNFPDTQFPRRWFRELFPRTCITRRLCIAKRNSID